jgi:hypothetical protein
MLKNSWTLAVSVAINISMKLCFVSVNGPRETYFVDEPRIMWEVSKFMLKVKMGVRCTKNGPECYNRHERHAARLCLLSMEPLYIPHGTAPFAIHGQLHTVWHNTSTTADCLGPQTHSRQIATKRFSSVHCGLLTVSKYQKKICISAANTGNLQLRKLQTVVCPYGGKWHFKQALAHNVPHFTELNYCFAPQIEPCPN